jgi:hypothetical protein
MLNVVLIVVPVRTVKPIAHVSILPEVTNIVPVPGAVIPEVIESPLITFTPVVPILLAIRDRLISLGRKIASSARTAYAAYTARTAYATSVAQIASTNISETGTDRSPR